MPRVDPPEVVAHIFSWFWELDAGRATALDYALLTYPDIDAWCRLRGIMLDPFELRAIKAMDATLISAVRKDRSNG